MVEGPLENFFASVGRAEVFRVPGLGVYLHSMPSTVPLALRDNILFNHVLHEQVLVVTIAGTDVPHVQIDNMLEIDTRYRAAGIVLVTIRQGFLDPARVPTGRKDLARFSRLSRVWRIHRWSGCPTFRTDRRSWDCPAI